MWPRRTLLLGLAIGSVGALLALDASFFHLVLSEAESQESALRRRYSEYEKTLDRALEKVQSGDYGTLADAKARESFWDEVNRADMTPDELTRLQEDAHRLSRIWDELTSAVEGDYYREQEGRAQEAYRRDHPPADAALYLMGKTGTVFSAQAADLVSDNGLIIFGERIVPTIAQPCNKRYPDRYDHDPLC